MRHQRTDLPPSKFKQKQHSHKSKSKRGTQVNTRIKDQPLRNLIQAKHTKGEIRCSKCGYSKHVEGFKCPARKFQCRTCNKYGHFTSLCYKKQLSFKSRNSKAHQLQARVVYAQEDSIFGQSNDLTSSDE